MSRLALHTPAGQLLAEGCRRLRLPDTAALELLRFLSVKQLHDSLPAARRPRSMSLGTAVDALWHWMLLNTRVSAAVHELLGGVVEHVGTDEEDLDDDAKMMQRLYSMGLMAAQGWTPDERLWTDAGTLMEAVAAVSSAGGITLYATPHTSAAQRQQLAEDLQVVHASVMREIGWAAPAAAQPGADAVAMQPGAGAAAAQPGAATAQPGTAAVATQTGLAMEVDAAVSVTGAVRPLMCLDVLVYSQAALGFIRRRVCAPADATVGDIRHALKGSSDAAVRAAAGTLRCMYCFGVGELRGGDVLQRRGISSGYVLRLQQRPPRFAGAHQLWLQPAPATAGAAGGSVIPLTGRVVPWMLTQELQQVVQAVEGTPVASQELSCATAAGAFRLHLDATLRELNVPLDGHTIITMRRDVSPLLALLRQPREQAAAVVQAPASSTAAALESGWSVRMLLPGGGAEVTLRLGASATAAAAKQLLAAHTGLPAASQQLVAWHLPEPLADGAVLADALGVTACDACGGRLLRLLPHGQPHPAAAEPLQLFVKTLTGKSIVLRSMGAAAYVFELKQAIWAREGVPLSRQRLISSGHQLEDGRTLGESGIQRDCTVHLLLRLDGC